MAADTRSFFEAFERNNAAGDIDALVSQFADPFLSADPTGTRTVKAADLKAALPKRKQLFKTIGCKTTTLISLEEQALDHQYVLVRTRWRWDFGDKGDVTLPSTFIVRRSSDTATIVFYLTHHDIMAVFRERRIIPN